MKRSELEKIMYDNAIFKYEDTNAINFVQKLLEFCADEIERNEPYATTSIKRKRDAAIEVNNLLYYIDECEEEE